MAYCIECNKNIDMMSGFLCQRCGSKIEFPKAQTLDAYNHAAYNHFQAEKESELLVLKEKLKWANLEKNKAKMHKRGNRKDRFKNFAYRTLRNIILGLIAGASLAYSYFTYKNGANGILVFLVATPGIIIILRATYLELLSPLQQQHSIQNRVTPNLIKSKIRRLRELKYSIENYKKLKSGKY